MKQKAVVFKISLNSSNIFNVRKDPDQLRKLVFDTISRHHTYIYTKGKFSYTLQILERDKEKKDLIIGRIIKYVKSDKEEKWNEDSQSIESYIRENAIEEKAYFCYDKETEYLVVEERAKLSSDFFKTAFAGIINYNNVDVCIDINPVIHAEEAIKRIGEITKIVTARFELIPNNPNPGTWNKFDEIAEAMEATNSKMEFQNPNGLKYKGVMAEMVSDVNRGMGRRYDIIGFDKDGNHKDVNSTTLKRNEYAEIVNSDEGRKDGVWKIMKELLGI